jgi:hypothetical protein
MNHRTYFLGYSVGLGILLGAMGSAFAEQKDESGFISMFDGQSLKGWSVTPKSAIKAWTVESGSIVGDGDKGRSNLVYKDHDIADFELKLSYRFKNEGNSGVSIRARKDETKKRHFQSYHVDFGHLGIGKQVLGAWDFHTPNRVEHACFRGDSLVIDKNDKPTVTKIDGAVTVDDIHRGEWNHVHVIAKDNHFQYFINGKLSSEFTEHLDKERRLTSGMILLQLHDLGMVVYFKNLRIKLLK